jgi:nitric oxide dioxygenase
MPAKLSEKTAALVRATVPALEAHGVAITQHMYERLFQNEAIRELFNQSHHGDTSSQPKALAAAFLAYARNIDELAGFGSIIEHIAQKHVALSILPEHYPFVGDALLGAIADVLGNAATPEIASAWGEAYWLLAEILIGREAAVYRKLAAQPGGWNGWRGFVVESVIDESAIIRSFNLLPVDGGNVVRHKPGQYLGFALDLPDVGPLRRYYSISGAPNERAYRITVKREAAPGMPPGLASNWLHDHALPGTVLRVSPPAGDFILDTTSDAPAVLVSGGVGLTPMVSMLETIATTQPLRPVWWVHGALNGRVHAMGRHVRNLAAGSPGMRATTFYSEPLDGETPEDTFDVKGLISVRWLAQNTPIDSATYYICGPKPLLRALVGGLLAHGVPPDRVRYEFFGPAGELLESAIGDCVTA